jgi:hypothetical protein
MPVTLATNALTTAAAVYDELGLAAPETPSDRVIRLINSKSQQVENYLKRFLGRRVYTEEAPELVQGAGGPWLFLSRFPIEAVESVLVDGSEVTFGRSDENDFWGLLHRADGWPIRSARNPLTGERTGLERAYNVAVAYTGGYKLPNASGDGIPLPADIEQVVLNEVVLAYRAPRHHVQEETTAGGRKVKYSAGSTGVAGGQLSNESKSILQAYVRTRTATP